MANHTKKGTNIRFTGYEKDPYEGGGSIGSFSANINPESIKHTRAINVNNEDVSNTAYDVYQFKGYGKESLTLALILDGTGYINDSGGSVRTQLNLLLKTIYDYVSGSHKAPFVKIEYGDTIKTKYWHCESLDVDYTLFDTNGNGSVRQANSVINI